MADADRDRDGRLQYQFIGLYDNDFAGREAIRSANIFNRSLIQYLNIFLLYPVMPCNPGEDYRVLGQRFLAANVQYRNIDWEIEDVLSEQLLSAFAKNHPNDVWVAQQARNRKHWEFSKDGKRLFSAYALANATLDDLWDVIGLLCALRSYLRLRFDHVACNIPTS
jgi:hypothetical protein